MIFTFDSLPNELFLHELFPYLSLIDLNYGFLFLNQRFKRLITLFLTKRQQHHIHLTRDITFHQNLFIIDSILPFLPVNHYLKSIQLCHENLFIKFLDNVNRIEINYLTKIIVTPFIDIHFDSVINLVVNCRQLHEIKLNVMTNLDSSWADGRKWTRWFDQMTRHNRQEILRIIHICIWCINIHDANHFDPRIWNQEGIYRENINWKVQLKPEQYLNWRQSRRAVECSRIDQDYITLLHDKPNSTCILV